MMDECKAAGVPFNVVFPVKPGTAAPDNADSSRQKSAEDEDAVPGMAMAA